MSYIDEKVQKYPELVSSNFIGESQKGKKIPIVFIKKNKNNFDKKLRVWMQGGLHGNEPGSGLPVLTPQNLHDLVHVDF